MTCIVSSRPKQGQGSGSCSFSCSLGVLYGGLGISKQQFFIKKIEINFSAINFLQFQVIKPWIRIRNQKKCWIRIRIKSMRIRNPEQGTGQYFKFFSFSNDFITRSIFLALFRPKTNHTCHQNSNPSHETVLLITASCIQSLYLQAIKSALFYLGIYVLYRMRIICNIFLEFPGKQMIRF